MLKLNNDPMLSPLCEHVESVGRTLHVRYGWVRQSYTLYVRFIAVPECFVFVMSLMTNDSLLNTRRFTTGNTTSSPNVF